MFTGINTNAIQWVNFFENECDGFGIKQDRIKIEIFRLLLGKSLKRSIKMVTKNY